MSRPPLERRLRAVSRIALYGSLALVGAVAWMLLDLAGAPLLREEGETWDQTDWAALEEVRLLREYIRIDTSEATGDVVAGVPGIAVFTRANDHGIKRALDFLGTDAMEREKMMLFASKEGRYLYRIEEALRRLYKEPDRFGFCHSCGELIDFDRLDALPHARYCIACKLKEEADAA